MRCKRPPRDALVWLRRQGLSDSQIARELNANSWTVCRWRREYGIAVDGSDVPPSDVVVLCDCGHVATHFDVPATIICATGLQIAVTYDLCDDCWQLEIEPVLTKGENVWNR